MVSPAVVRTMFRSTRSDAVVFALTAVVTVSFDLIVAVGIGLAAAAFFALRALSRASGVHREELPGPVRPDDERIALFRVDGALFFGATERMVDRVAQHAGIDVVVLRLSQVQILDATGAHALAELVTRLERRGVTVLLKGVRPQHVTLMRRLDVLDSLRHQNHLFDDLEPAVEHARSHVARARHERGADAPAPIAGP
jgi:SulP family sulfate permease